MKLLVDENIPKRTVEALRGAGHDVIDVRGTALQAASDQELWRLAQEQRAVLISTDRGFARRRDEDHAGMLIVRLRRPNRERIHERVMRAVHEVQESEWPGLLVVMRDQVQSRWRRGGPSG